MGEFLADFLGSVFLAFLIIGGLVLLLVFITWVTDHIYNTFLLLLFMVATASVFAGVVVALIGEDEEETKEDCTVYLNENGNEDYEVCMIEGSWEDYERDHEPR